jgi:hypothetical protein
MTRPTEEQIKALKPGDRILIEATVNHVHKDDISVRIYNSWSDLHVGPSVIASIEPRPLEVGDRVKWGAEAVEVTGPLRAYPNGDSEVGIWSDRLGYTGVNPVCLERIA